MFAWYRAPVVCGATVLLLALAGCGQKGPLFMPVKSAPPAATPLAPVTPSAPAMTLPSGAVVPSNK